MFFYKFFGWTCLIDNTESMPNKHLNNILIRMLKNTVFQLWCLPGKIANKGNPQETYGSMPGEHAKWCGEFEAPRRNGPYSQYHPWNPQVIIFGWISRRTWYLVPLCLTQREYAASCTGSAQLSTQKCRCWLSWCSARPSPSSKLMKKLWSIL